MIHTMLNINVNSNKEIRNYTEQNMQATTQVFTVMKESKLYEVVDCILREKKGEWINHIFFLMNQEKVSVIKKYNNELVILDQICNICREEIISTGGTILEKVSSLKELKEIYQETVFQFRRMELETEERYEEFEEFMSKWKFSIVYIKLILENGAIYNKANVAKKLIEIFSAKGNVEYSNELYDFLK